MAEKVSAVSQNETLPEFTKRDLAKIRKARESNAENINFLFNCKKGKDHHVDAFDLIQFGSVQIDPGVQGKTQKYIEAIEKIIKSEKQDGRLNVFEYGMLEGLNSLVGHGDKRIAKKHRQLLEYCGYSCKH
ncbi:MAG: hypothetical protein GX568_10115 [Candidatus Gastranaerophilales bacterium]|nr:hypothetical protein [Candidatus Gastranaerophilales bacterium]